MIDAKRVLKEKIRQAFSDVKYPGDFNLVSGNEGDEPGLVQDEFKGKSDWEKLAPEFIDQAPDGLSSALNFFSDEAFRFYLPAYLVADIDDQLDSVNPVFHLCYGLTDKDRKEEVNPKRYGDETWGEVEQKKFAIFNTAQKAALVEYLQFKAQKDEVQRDEIQQALRNYWAKPEGRA